MNDNFRHVSSPPHTMDLGPKGSELRSGYEWMRTHPGYWNDYGEYEFTVEDFLGLFSYWEIYSIGNGSQDENLLEASARRMFSGPNKINCPEECSADQIFDYLARNGGSVQTDRINAILNRSDAGHPGLRGGSYGEMMVKARDWGKRILHTPSYRIQDGNRPSDWGNPGAITYNLTAAAVDRYQNTTGMSVVIGTTDEQGIFYWDDNFMILTANQAQHWTTYP